MLASERLSTCHGCVVKMSGGDYTVNQLLQKQRREKADDGTWQGELASTEAFIKVLKQLGIIHHVHLMKRHTYGYLGLCRVYIFATILFLLAPVAGIGGLSNRLDLRVWRSTRAPFRADTCGG